MFDTGGSLQKTQNFIYDNGHRLLNDGIYSYTYGAPSCSCANRVETVTDSRGTTSYEYDYKGRVKKTIYPDGTIVESIYDETAKTRTVKLDGVEVFTVGLNGEGQGVSVNEKTGGGNNIFSITRDNAGRITQVLYPNKDKSITEYDVEGRIVKHKNYYKTHLINKFEYTLDNEGNKMSERTNIGTRRYGYDEIYQLTSAVYERNQQFTWQYDAAGNRISSAEWQMPNAVYVTNNLNQYTSVNSVNYSYDADGNLLSNGRQSFTWDIRNRLTGVNGVSYKYDHNDLRVEKTKGSEKTMYYYDGSLLLCEKNEAGNVHKVYINDGEGIVGFIRYIYDDSGTFSHYQRLYYLYDSLGSVSYITGENGLPLQNYTYSPYGSTLNLEHDSLNGLRFVGRYGGYKDDHTGLTYFWHRWYDERDGRWVSRDPVGLDAGINVYQYVFNIPNYFIDWYGLCPDGEPKPVPLPRPNQPYVDPGWYNWNKLPWDARIPPRHGNYCGKNWSEGRFKLEGEENTFTVPALDDIDECCRKHDECSYKVRSGREKCKTIPNCNKDLILNMFSPNLIIRNICGYIIYLILPLLWLGIIIYFL